MIEAIGSQPSGMVELQNVRQRLWVDGDFAAAFRGATRESQESGDVTKTAATVTSLQKAVESARALSAGANLTPLASTALPASTGTKSAPAATGWSGPAGETGSSNNPIAAWDQTPGQQPSWITGTYPGADWSAVNEAGFLMPYGSLAPGPGEDVYSNANANVVNQDWAKFYDQTDGTQAGNQIVWGANNPTDAISAPWMASTNSDPQYTKANPSDSSQPTQPNFVVPNPAS